MVTQPILNSLIFTTLQNWHFLTALQIGRKFQWLPDGLCYHSEATDITKKGNFSGFLWNIPVVEEATEIDYFLWEATVFAYQKLLISVASEFILILGVVIGTIAGISYFLRQAVIDNSVSKKKRRKRSYSLANLILAGKV